MLVIPALEVQNGACISPGPLIQHGRAAAVAAGDDPLDVARTWVRFGFRRLHVVDRDAAHDRGSNAEIVRNLLAELSVPVQVDGGVASADFIDRSLRDGADRVIVDVSALADLESAADLASSFAGRVIVAIDVRDRRVVMREPARAFTRTATDLVAELGRAPLAGILVTVLHRDSVSPRDLFLLEDLAESSEHPILLSGGVTTLRELRSVQDRGIGAVVLGRPLYEAGELDPRVVAEEFAESW